MFHANGWTFVWIVTAVGAAHICLRNIEPRGGFWDDGSEVGHPALCRTHRLTHLAHAPELLRRAPRVASAC